MELMLRRDFLAVSGAGIASLLAGCKNHHRKSVGPVQYLFLEEEKEFWEDVGPYINHSLEGGFSFDFTSTEPEELAFGDVVEIDGEQYALNAQGYSFSSFFQDQEKRFTLASLRKDKRGFALDLVEGEKKVVFEKPGDLAQININEKEYLLQLDGVAIQNSEGAYFPLVSLMVNGEPYDLLHGKGISQGLNLALNLKKFRDQGEIELFVSQSMFSSRHHLGGELRFSGLEDVVMASGMQLEKIREANLYNQQEQGDAYFRVDAAYDQKNKVITLRKADKIRIPDDSLEDFVMRRESKGSYHRIREADALEIISKSRDRKKIFTDFPAVFQGLEGNFLVEFAPPLEARIEAGQDLSFPQEFFNVEFTIGNKNYLMRYLGFDSRKVRMSAQAESNLPWNVFYPLSSVFTEMLEEPRELSLSPGESRSVQVDGEEYLIMLRKMEQIDGFFPVFDYIFEVEKSGRKDEGRIKTFAHSFPNRVLDLNIDPDIKYYWDKFDYQVRGQPQKFFISRNKFSSAPDFSDDLHFSGLKKELIPDYETPFTIIDENGNRKGFEGSATYQQMTLANRFNGKIQDAGFRVHAELGLSYYEKISPDPEKDGYKVIPSKGFDLADQIQHSYVLRIMGFEKVMVLGSER